MTYMLGVDIGGTYTAAAIWRDGSVQSVPLGNRSNAVPSVLFLRDDGVLLVGEAASRRAVVEPDRQARDFKRRMGDDVPIMLGDRSMSAAELTGHLLRWVIGTVSEREGERPAHLVLTHPAGWGDYRRDLLVESAATADFRDVGLLVEPVAAAAWYAVQRESRVEPGALIGVYDLGGGTFDASVVRKTDTGFEVVGEPGGDDSIGGLSFDHLLQPYVAAAAGVDLTSLDDTDPAVASALATFRDAVVEAKEALSTDVEAVIPVLFPGLAGHVTISRTHLESLIRPQVLSTVQLFAQIVSRAGVEPGKLHSVLLIGGSSRIPLVAQLLRTELGVRVTLDAHPKYAVSLGAAITGAPRVAVPRPQPQPPPPSQVSDPPPNVSVAALGLSAVAALDSDAPSSHDSLGISSDVEMLAKLVAAASTTPPLSIALLGNWGAGKSTFMLQMQHEVAELARLAARNRGRSTYVEAIRQVTFNAWDYSDDRVWTGLIERLFRTLAAEVSGSGDPAHPTPQQAQARAAALREELASLAGDDRRLVEDLDRIDTAPKAPGRFAGLATPTAVARVIRALLREAWADVRNGRVALLGLAALAAAAAVAWWLAGSAGANLATAVAAVTLPVVCAVAALAGPAWRAVQTASRFVERERTRLRERQEQTRRRIAELGEQLVLADAAAALAAFLVERGTTSAYASFRGLVGQVRDDLDQLQKQLARARDHWSANGPDTAPLERIVLYVDDLDRCPPARVVDVLAAVHLLLALPLFVVVVAVDARWLLRSLDQHQSAMFTGDTLTTRQLPMDVVTPPLDYLDKIFQVPFALRPMGDRAGAYLASLLPEVDDESGETVETGGGSATFRAVATENSGQNTAASGGAGQAGGQRPVSPELVDPNAADQYLRSARSESAQPQPGAKLGYHSGAGEADPGNHDPAPANLRITVQEREFLPRLARFVPTPRAGKKLVNLYRLVRIGVPADELDAFVGRVDNGGAYQTVAILLSVLVGRPIHAHQLFAVIQAGNPTEDIVNFLRTDRPESVQDAIWRDTKILRDEVAITIKEIRDGNGSGKVGYLPARPVLGELSTYQRWCPEIARFSFTARDA